MVLFVKLALISDIHFGARLDSKLFLDNILRFLTSVFIPYLIENKITTVLMLGDIWDKRKIINVNTLYRCRTEFFDVLERLGINVVVIYGNHDVVYKNTNDINSIDVTLGQYKNVRIIKDYDVINFDGTDIAFTSWITPESLAPTLEWITKVKASILMGHFEVDKFMFPDSTVYKDATDISVFKRFDMVFSGHYHVRSTTDNFTYIGNPSQTTWGDYGIKKGFHVLDTSTRETVFIENRYEMYHKIPYSDDLDINSFDYEFYRNTIVSIIVQSLASINIQKYNLFLDMLSTVVYSYETEESIVHGERDEKDISSMHSVSDTAELIKQYIGSVFESVENLDQTAIEKYVLDLYKQAIGMEK